MPRFVYENSFMSKIDDKSGYGHVLMTKESTNYFGIEWGGFWWVCKTLPFGWKNSPYVYQTIGLVATNIFSQKGIACSLYIDDRLNGELFMTRGHWSHPVGQRDPEYSYKSAEVALYIVCKVLTHLGYYLGLKKCVLVPGQRILYLDMLVDSTLQVFSIPDDKRINFANFRESILNRRRAAPLRSFQKLMGKGVSFSLAFLGAKFYIREMVNAIGRKSTKGEIQMPSALREEIESWLILGFLGQPHPLEERETLGTVSFDRCINVSWDWCDPYSTRRETRKVWES